MFAVRESRIPHAEKDLRAFLDDPDPASGPDLLEELLANLGHEGLDVGPRHVIVAVGPDSTCRAVAGSGGAPAAPWSGCWSRP